MTDMALISIDPNAAILQAKARYQTLKNLTQEILVEGIDYGTIPGTDKPCLYKAGSEKLCSTFGLDPRFEILDKIENFSDEAGLFHYTILCKLIHIGTGAEIATGIGSCNSKENRYRWRWVSEEDIPAYLDKKTLKKRDSSISEPQFAVDKAETTGKYGKPMEYWQQFRDAIANHTAYPSTRPTKNGTEMAVWNIPSVSWRIPNDEVFTLANTINKMACKRALVAATLIGTNCSEFYTQDLDDMSDFSSDFVVSTARPVVPKSEPAPAPAKTDPDKDLDDAIDRADKKDADAAAKAKVKQAAKDKALEAERDKLTAELVGEDKMFGTQLSLRDAIIALGFRNYAHMRETLSYENVVEALLRADNPEPALQSAEPAVNGAAAKAKK